MKVNLKLFLSFLFVVNSFSVLFADIDPKEILNRVDNKMYFKSGFSKMKILDYKEGNLTKTFEVEVLFDTDRGSLMTFTNPPREKGKKILLVKDNMWMSVPGVSRPVRLSTKDSFMGTSFSNRDLLDYDLANDYLASIVKRTESEYILELKANNLKLPYPKIILSVDANTFLPKYMELYSASGIKVKEMKFYDIKNFEGKMRPSVIEVRDILTQGNYTKVITESLQTRTVNPSVFSPDYLSR